MCSYCIVPFVRGRERSRSMKSILEEIVMVRDLGINEIVFLGQNVNSYHYEDESGQMSRHENSSGFSELYKLRREGRFRFADVLDMSARLAPEVRFRFTSPHPKDFPETVLQIINQHNNICKAIHLPA